MHVVSYQGGLESSKNIVHGRQPRACRPVESRGRFSPFQHISLQPAAPSPERRVAARVISTRLNRARYKQHQLQDQMVLQDLMPKVTGVGSALPHLQDCVYLGEQSSSCSHVPSVNFVMPLLGEFTSWHMHGRVPASAGATAPDIALGLHLVVSAPAGTWREVCQLTYG